MMTRRLSLFLLAAVACTSTTPVARKDWGALNNQTGKVAIRMKDGTRYNLSSFQFTESGVEALAGNHESRRSKSRIGMPVTIQYDSVDVVQLTRGNSTKTLAMISIAATAAYFIVGQTIDNTRPDPVPRPPSTSCPFIYSFDGREWRMDSETYSGAVARGLERTDVDNLDYIAAVDGIYRLALANEADESEYTDQLSLMVAEHPADTRVFPDADGKLHTVTNGVQPVSIRKHNLVSAPAKTRWDLTFNRPKGDHLSLVLRVRNTDAVPFVHLQLMNILGEDVYSWYREVNTNPDAAARTLRWYTEMAGLQVSTATGKSWRQHGTVPIVGPVVAKTIVMPVDVSNSEDVVRVRLESSPMLWNIESAELVAEREAPQAYELELMRAVDATGQDVASQLRSVDGRYHVALNGSRVVAEFRGVAAKPGMRQTVLAKTTGHYYANSTDDRKGNAALASRLMTRSTWSQAYFMAQYKLRR